MLVNSVVLTIYNFILNIDNNSNINKNNELCLTRKEEMIQCHVCFGSDKFKPDYFIHF